MNRGGMLHETLVQHPPSLYHDRIFKKFYYPK